jgi:hypothetical protein
LVRHEVLVRIAPSFAASLLLMTACAEPPGPGEEGPPNVPADVPDAVEIVCEADGSTTVRTPQVVVQPDGIHVRVLSHLDEPAEIVGLGRDVEPGATEYVSVRGPGRIETGCNPYSQHEPGGKEPMMVPVDVLDPDGIYVPGEIECSGTASGMIADFFEEPLDAGPVPLPVARDSIRGLHADDEVFHTGYPEQRDRVVAVRRDGEIVATFDLLTFDGEKWSVASNHICSSSGLR